MKKITQRQHLYTYLRYHSFQVIPCHVMNTWYQSKKFTSELGRLCRRMKDEGLFRRIIFGNKAVFILTKKGVKAMVDAGV